MNERKLDFKVIGWNASYSDSIVGTSCSAITLHNKDVYLLDCGFGALAGIFRNGIKPSRIKGILVTHTHLDHVGGIPELQWYLMNNNIERTLDIVSPQPISGLPFSVNYVDSLLGAITIPLLHRIPTQGYRFGDDLAYITDTRANMNVIEAIRGVKILYHESTYEGKDTIKAKKWDHTTSLQAAQVAKEAKVEKLILGHFSHSADPEKILKEAQTIFKETYLPM